MGALGKGEGCNSIVSMGNDRGILGSARNKFLPAGIYGALPRLKRYRSSRESNKWFSLDSQKKIFCGIEER